MITGEMVQYKIPVTLDTDEERRFVQRAVARNIPMIKAVELLYWQQQGIVNLESFFDVKEK